MKPVLQTMQRQRPAIRGFTVLELLVALTIGLLLTAVIAQLFLGSRATYATTDDLSRVQENTRYAHQMLTRSVHLAQYRTQPNSIAGSVFSGGNVALAATNGGGTASDTITVRYQGHNDAFGAADGSVLDCLGNRIAAGVMAVNTFSIAAGANGNNALFCSTGGAPVEIVSDVENMQIVFGEDTNADLTADRYVALPDVANLNNVVSVRIAMLFESPGLTAVTLDTRQYTLNDVVLGPYNDRRLRRVVTTTINLRNRTP